MNYDKIYIKLYKSLIKDIEEKVKKHNNKINFYDNDEDIYSLPVEYYIKDTYAELYYITSVEMEKDKLYFKGESIEDRSVYYFESISINPLLEVYEIIYSKIH